MGRVLYVDPIGGAAGDMLLAALLDSGAPVDAVREAIDAVMPGRYRISTVPVTRGGLRSALLVIDPPAAGQSPRSVGDLIASVAAAPLGHDVAAKATAILHRLGVAEAFVHGADSGSGDHELHELGDDDTLVDAVGFAAACEALGVDRILVAPVRLEAGSTAPARGHGRLPLPAPATLELLKGFEIRVEAGTEETVTPTAAAILAALGEPAPHLPAAVLDAVGYGAGSRDPTDRPNVVRVLLGSADAPEASRSREVVVLEANLDDMTPELVADGARALFAAGALDAWTTPVHMKKGRPGVVLAAMCEPRLEAAIRHVFFECTSTFGVRAHDVRRAELERRIVAVDVGAGTVRVKVGLLEGQVVTASPEHDDVAGLAERAGLPVREVYEQAAAAARALRMESTPRS